MDTNPFATNPGLQQQATPSYLQQQPAQGAGAAGAMSNVANMVKAMMDGNNKFNQKQAMNSTSMNPGTTTGGPSVGAPLSLAPPAGSPGPTPNSPFPPVNPSSMPGASSGPMGPVPPGPMGGMPTMGADGSNPFINGAQPIAGLDPVMSGLFSPIPGGNGGQF